MLGTPLGLASALVSNADQLPSERWAAWLGVAALPGYVCAGDVAAGRLIRLLPEWTAGTPEISLMTHGRRGNPPQVDALADFLLRELPDVMMGDGDADPGAD